MLEIKNVTISYKDRPTVKNFSMTLKKGEIASIVGESGSGKTTVIRAVLGLLPGGGRVTEGDILFEGKSLLKNTAEEWRNLRGTDISMIFQDSGAMLNPIRKIGSVFVEYIRTHEKVSRKAAWEKGREMLEQMRLPRDEWGTSIIMVTHNLGVAAYMSDQILVMKEGQIADTGSRDQILKGGRSIYTQELLEAVPSLGGDRYV